MATVTIHVQGAQNIAAKIEQIKREIPIKVGASMYMEAEVILTASKQEIPVDTSAAKNSGFVAEPVITGDDIKLEFGYGGVATKINPKSPEPSTTYLIPLHENLTQRHRVGKAKFLEDPVKAAEPSLLTRIARRLRVMFL